MKKNFSLTLLLAAASFALLPSCDKNDNDEPVNESIPDTPQPDIYSYSMANLVIETDGTVSATPGSYSMEINPEKTLGILSTDNLYFQDNLQNFATDGMSLLFGANDSYAFSGGSSVSGTVKAENVSGYVPAQFNIISEDDVMLPGYDTPVPTPLIMSYNVGNGALVKTFSTDAVYSGSTEIATVGSDQAPYINGNIRYRVKFDESLKYADIIFYNANFAVAMPVTINFSLQNLDVEYSDSGYTITGEDITPMLYMDGALTPAPAYQVTEFKLSTVNSELTEIKANYKVFMMGRNYAGSFSGESSSK